MADESDRSDVRVGVDVGGTNTDVILVTGDGEYTHKTPSTADPSQSTIGCCCHGISCWSEKLCGLR